MWFNYNQLIILNDKINVKSNWVSDELTFNTSDNNVAPDEPILFKNGMWFNNNQLIIFINKLIPRSNWVSDELTFNAEDNDVAPDSSISLQMECDSIIIN